MNLIYLDDLYNIQIDPQLLTLKDFKKLKDTRDRDTLIKELGYLYHFYNLKSDFQFQTNKEKRHEEVKKFLGLPEKWKPDKQLSICIKVYIYLSQTVAGGILESAYLMTDKIKEQIESIDLNERNAKTGSPVWDLKKMLETAKGIPEMLEVLRKAELEFLKGQTENDKLRGDKLKTLYEDGFMNMSFEDIEQENTKE